MPSWNICCQFWNIDVLVYVFTSLHMLNLSPLHIYSHVYFYLYLKPWIWSISGRIICRFLYNPLTLYLDFTSNLYSYCDTPSDIPQYLAQYWLNMNKFRRFICYFLIKIKEKNRFKKSKDLENTEIYNIIHKQFNIIRVSKLMVMIISLIWHWKIFYTS